MIEHRRLEPPEVGTGFHAELLDQLGAGGVEFPQGLGLSARTVQRQHHLGPEAFPQWMFGDEHPERRDGLLVVTQQQPGIDLLLEGGGPQLSKALDLGHGKRLLRHILQRFPPPQVQRRAQLAQGELGVAARWASEPFARRRQCRSNRCTSTEAGSRSST